MNPLIIVDIFLYYALPLVAFNLAIDLFDQKKLSTKQRWEIVFSAYIFYITITLLSMAILTECIDILYPIYTQLYKSILMMLITIQAKPYWFINIPFILLVILIVKKLTHTLQEDKKRELFFQAPPIKAGILLCFNIVFTIGYSLFVINETVYINELVWAVEYFLGFSPLYILLYWYSPYFPRINFRQYNKIERISIGTIIIALLSIILLSVFTGSPNIPAHYQELMGIPGYFYTTLNYLNERLDYFVLFCSSILSLRILLR